MHQNGALKHLLGDMDVWRESPAATIVPQHPEADLGNLTTSEARLMLRRLGLPAVGGRMQLVQRLKKAGTGLK